MHKNIKRILEIIISLLKNKVSISNEPISKKHYKKEKIKKIEIYRTDINMYISIETLSYIIKLLYLFSYYLYSQTLI